MASEESSRESSSETRSETRSEKSSDDSEDNPTSEMESVFVESSDSQRPNNNCSDIRNYFTKNAGGKKVFCRLCNNEYSYLGTMSKLRDHSLSQQ